MINWSQLDARQKDALVAEHIMGYSFMPLPETNQIYVCDWCGRWSRQYSRETEGSYCDDLCDYTSNFLATEVVIDILTLTNVLYIFELEIVGHRTAARFTKDRTSNDRWSFSQDKCDAICLAALRTKGLEIDP